MSRLEVWLKSHTRNTAHKATTLVRYYLFESRFFSVCLHKFLRDDSENEFHNHPFIWVSFFFGSYIEHRLNEPKRRRWFVNWGGKTFHRVEDTQNMWTIMFRGPERWSWSYKRI
jgi:hypothetical protein